MGQLGHGNEGTVQSVAKEVLELEDVSIKQVEAFHEKTAVVTEDGQLIFWGRTKDGSMVDANGKHFQSNLSTPTMFESDYSVK